MNDIQGNHGAARLDWARRGAALLGLAALLVALYFALHTWREAGAPVTTAAPAGAAVRATPAPAPAVPAPKADATSPPRHPIAQGGSGVLLTLDSSDAAFLADVARLSGERGLFQWLQPGDIIRHIVATVDALPRRQVPPAVMPTKPVPGSLVVWRRDDADVIGPENAARYASYVRLLTDIDPIVAATVYRRYFPLFQKAYRDLGYPAGYFNDRLIVAIDDALATPPAPSPLRVEAPGGMWRYADPDLEDLSAAQKILLRMGQDNARAVCAWLRAFRAAIA